MRQGMDKVKTRDNRINQARSQRTYYKYYRIRHRNNREKYQEQGIVRKQESSRYT